MMPLGVVKDSHVTFAKLTLEVPGQSQNKTTQENFMANLKTIIK